MKYSIVLVWPALILICERNTLVNIFELFVKLTHPVKKSGWVETTAYFTGEYRSPRRTGMGRYPSPVRVSSATNYYEYMIRYYTEDGERTGWYLFYPGPDPSPEDIRGLTFQIRYRKRRPWIFEMVHD